MSLPSKSYDSNHYAFNQSYYPIFKYIYIPPTPATTNPLKKICSKNCNFRLPKKFFSTPCNPKIKPHIFGTRFFYPSKSPDTCISQKKIMNICDNFLFCQVCPARGIFTHLKCFQQARYTPVRHLTVSKLAIRG